MATDAVYFADWLATACLPEAGLTPAQRHVLEAAFQFRQRCGTDYFSTRLLSHWLLHSHTGLQVTQIARLLGLSRSAASAQQGRSSKEVIQAAHHRLAGRAHGKLLPRFAGPLAYFLQQHPRASRYDLLDFIERTWQVRVTRQALHKFLKKYGLVQAGRRTTRPAVDSAAAPGPAAADPVPTRVAAQAPTALATGSATPALPVPLPPRSFFLLPPSTRAPSCCCLPPSIGSLPPRSASPIPTVPCAADC
jgi:transposase